MFSGARVNLEKNSRRSTCSAGKTHRQSKCQRTGEADRASTERRGQELHSDGKNENLNTEAVRDYLTENGANTLISVKQSDPQS